MDRLGRKGGFPQGEKDPVNGSAECQSESFGMKIGEFGCKYARSRLKGGALMDGNSSNSLCNQPTDLPLFIIGRWHIGNIGKPLRNL